MSSCIGLSWEDCPVDWVHILHHAVHLLSNMRFRHGFCTLASNTDFISNGVSHSYRFSSRKARFSLFNANLYLSIISSITSFLGRRREVSNHRELNKHSWKLIAILIKVIFSQFSLPNWLEMHPLKVSFLRSCLSQEFLSKLDRAYCLLVFIEKSDSYRVILINQRNLEHFSAVRT